MADRSRWCHRSAEQFAPVAANRWRRPGPARRHPVDARGHGPIDRGHHRLTIDPAADNEPAIACYAGVGFQPVGVLRAYERRGDGNWADGLLMELLATDPRP